MFYNIQSYIALIAPAAFIATAVASHYQPGLRPRLVKKLGFAASILNLFVVAICGWLVINQGLVESDLLGAGGIGFSIRLDVLSILMLALIALLGFVIIKFSNNYLDGDSRQGAFIGRLAATIASVQLLVMSGNLGLLLVSWILTSMSLHRLLLFYFERPGAQTAAKKKYILARIGDVCLLIAIFMLYGHFETGNLEVIFSGIRNNVISELPFMAVEGPALFIAFAAILKSAQFPTHGWLIEVMETPTPVSALLHAGLLNAGPFLIIRFAFLIDASTLAPIILMVIGGFTALFASVAYLTQTSIKTALGYSSIAHMGFSLMVCGLGVFPAAMLHMTAHSFYKAHAFLSSGSVIDVIRASKITMSKRTVESYKVLLGSLLALTFYALFAMAWQIDPVNEFSLLILGAIITLGMARIFTAALESNGTFLLLFQSSFLALIVTASFFVLEAGAGTLLATQVPHLAYPGTGKIAIAIILLLVFTSVVFIQILSPKLVKRPFYSALAIHVRNGFYANAVFDKLLSTLRIQTDDYIIAVPRKSTKGQEHEKAELENLKEQIA